MLFKEAQCLFQYRLLLLLQISIVFKREEEYKYTVKVCFKIACNQSYLLLFLLKYNQYNLDISEQNIFFSGLVYVY